LIVFVKYKVKKFEVQ